MLTASPSDSEQKERERGSNLAKSEGDLKEHSQSGQQRNRETELGKDRAAQSGLLGCLLLRLADRKEAGFILRLTCESVQQGVEVEVHPALRE